MCKEAETRRFPPRAKRGGKKKDSPKPFACTSNKRMFVFFLNRASSDHQNEEAPISLKNKRNEVETDIQEVKCKSPQGGCIREEVEEECNSSFLVGDLWIIAQGFGSCMGVLARFSESRPIRRFCPYNQLKAASGMF